MTLPNPARAWEKWTCSKARPGGVCGGTRHEEDTKRRVSPGLPEIDAGASHRTSVGSVREQLGTERGRAEHPGYNSPTPSPSPRPRSSASPSSPAGSFVAAPRPPLRVSGSAFSELAIGPPCRRWAWLRVAEARYIVKVGRAPSANFSARGLRARVSSPRSAPLVLPGDFPS